jgi:hypothetical protein
MPGKRSRGALGGVVVVELVGWPPDLPGCPLMVVVVAFVDELAPEHAEASRASANSAVTTPADDRTTRRRWSLVWFFTAP